MRSWNIHRVPTVHPWSTSPTRSLSGHAHVGHELLAEVLEPVEHLDALDLHALLVERQDEHGQSTVLRHVPVRPRQTQAPVGEPRPGGPHLGPVEDPLLAVAHGGHQRAGDVGTAARFGQQLHPEFLTLEDRREVTQLLLLGAELEEHRRARRERRCLDPEGIGESRQLLVECRLVRGRETLTAVLAREADAGEPGVEERPLQRAGGRDLGQVLVVGVPRPELADLVGQLARRQGLPDPGAGAGAELLDRLDVVLAHQATSSV